MSNSMSILRQIERDIQLQRKQLMNLSERLDKLESEKKCL